MKVTQAYLQVATKVLDASGLTEISQRTMAGAKLSYSEFGLRVERKGRAALIPATNVKVVELEEISKTDDRTAEHA